MKDDQITKIWERYEKSRDFMNGKRIVAKTDENWRFYLGDQWHGLQAGGERLPMQNFVKPIIRYKVAVIAHNTITARFSDLERRPELKGVFDVLDKKFASDWERAKMDARIWKILKAAAIQGDSYMFFGTGDAADGQIIANTSVLLGDEQQPEIQKQPYIMIYERRSVEAVKREAKENGIEEADIALIGPDEEVQYMIGEKEEVKNEGKCVSVLWMERGEDDIIRIARSTKTCVYEPLHALTVTKDKKTVGGLRSYPLVNLIWEEKPNSARGQSQVEVLVPNQIEHNRTLARRSIAVKLCAYPRLVYDADLVGDNKGSLDLTGAKIEIRNPSGQNLNSIVGYISPASMSPDAKALSEDLVTVTKDLEGAGDAAVGQVNPEKASGAAIVAVRDQAALPLNEQVAAYKQFVEDLARLWYDLWATYEPNGFEVAYEKDGEEYMGIVTGEDLEGLRVDVRVDVSPDNPWTKYAEQQELSSIYAKGDIDLAEYLEASPPNAPLPVEKLKRILENRPPPAPEGVPAQGAIPAPEGVAQGAGGIPAGAPGTDEEYMRMMGAGYG
jgi:cellobiose-specific phosphotransferase system component IIB